MPFGERSDPWGGVKIPRNENAVHPTPTVVALLDPPRPGEAKSSSVKML
jgi:hypothetical protein